MVVVTTGLGQYFHIVLYRNTGKTGIADGIQKTTVEEDGGIPLVFFHDLLETFKGALEHQIPIQSFVLPWQGIPIDGLLFLDELTGDLRDDVHAPLL